MIKERAHQKQRALELAQEKSIKKKEKLTNEILLLNLYSADHLLLLCLCILNIEQ